MRHRQKRSLQIPRVGRAGRAMEALLRVQPDLRNYIVEDSEGYTVQEDQRTFLGGGQSFLIDALESLCYYGVPIELYRITNCDEVSREAFTQMVQAFLRA